jgi:hypothetical protein
MSTPLFLREGPESPLDNSGVRILHLEYGNFDQI